MPSHYLKQCWFIISEHHWQFPCGNTPITVMGCCLREILLEIPQTSITKITFKITYLSFKSPRGQWVNAHSLCFERSRASVERVKSQSTPKPTDFETIFLQYNFKQSHHWYIIIGLDDGLVPVGTKPFSKHWWPGSLKHPWTSVS